MQVALPPAAANGGEGNDGGSTVNLLRKPCSRGRARLTACATDLSSPFHPLTSNGRRRCALLRRSKLNL